MGKAGSPLHGMSPAAGVASAAGQWSRKVEATGTAIRTWLGYRAFASVFDGGQWPRYPEEPAQFQAVIKRSVAGLPDSLVPPSFPHMAVLLHFAEHTCLPAEQVEKILKFMTSKYARKPDLAASLAAPLERQRFRTAEAEAIRGSVCFVSLGLACVPWKMLNRWGLRSEADFAGSFNPFALAKHRAPGVIEALASDFSGYCQPEALMTVKTMAGHVVPARKDRQVLWTHHRGADWADDNFAPLIENMAWKIANFRATCRRPNTVFVMSDAPDPEKDAPYPSNLQEALARHTGRQDNHIILTNQSTSPHGNGLHRIDGTTFFLRCPQPVKGYAWNVDENYDSPEGLAFERDYIGLICQALRQWGLIERQDARASTT